VPRGRQCILGAHMPAPTSPVNDFITHWARKWVVFPLLVLLAAAVLLVSELAYYETHSTLRGGIALTESRLQSARLLQLLTEAETAEYGFLLTRQEAFATRLEAARKELPAMQLAVAQFLIAQGPEGAAAARQVVDLSDHKFAQVVHSIELARTGDISAASEHARDETTYAETATLRDLLNAQLTRATAMQQAARVTIYDALLAGRVLVGLLTLTTLVGLFLFLRQIRRQDRERSEERGRLESEVKSRTLRLTELARHFQTVREDERASVARELHDELGALLTVSKLEIARARNKANQPDEIVASLSRVIQSLDQGIALKRRIIEDLSPSSLTHLGLNIALENLCNDMSTSLAIPVQLSMTPFRLSPAAQLAVYRFVQEALTNIGKYARATEVTVTVTSLAGHAAVEVHDNGIGFDSELSRAGRHGLSGMQFRAESLGGTMSVFSTAGKGTTLRIEFPQLPNEE
jgi:signal transduction histidine kinase